MIPPKPARGLQCSFNNVREYIRGRCTHGTSISLPWGEKSFTTTTRYTGRQVCPGTTWCGVKEKGKRVMDRKGRRENSEHTSSCFVICDKRYKEMLKSAKDYIRLKFIGRKY